MPDTPFNEAWLAIVSVLGFKEFGCVLGSPDSTRDAKPLMQVAHDFGMVPVGPTHQPADKFGSLPIVAWELPEPDVSIAMVVARNTCTIVEVGCEINGSPYVPMMLQSFNKPVLF